jgi:hypothetical protein
MKIFRINISDTPSLEEIEDLIKRIKLIQANELDFNDIIGLCSLLDVEYRPEYRSGGSLEKFYCKHLERVPGFTHGLFSIHIIHKGGSKKMVYKRNIFQTIKHLETIIKIKRSKK